MCMISFSSFATVLMFETASGTLKPHTSDRLPHRSKQACRGRVMEAAGAPAVMFGGVVQLQIGAGWTDGKSSFVGKDEAKMT